MHIPIRDNIPPISPTVCLFERRSLNNTADITELKTIALPFTSGKNNWLGKSPDNFKFKKFIVKVHTPQIIANGIKFFLSLKFFLSFTLKPLMISEIKKETNRKPLISDLCEDV